MVDKDVLKQRLLLLYEYISDLEDMGRVSYSEYLRDKVTRRYAERTLQLAIEACLDIGSHIISDLGLREPEDNKGIFLVLAEKGLIDSSKEEAYRRMAGFRNVLVHDYARLDPEIVFFAITDGVADLRGFARSVKEKFLG